MEMSEATADQELQNVTEISSRLNEVGGEATFPESTSGPDPVALVLSGTVVTLLLLCLCCLCKFRGKPLPITMNRDMTQPTMVVTQRTYIHSTSMDLPPPYTPPPEFPGNGGLWPPTALQQRCPETPPPPYSVTITAHRVVPGLAVPATA